MWHLLTKWAGVLILLRAPMARTIHLATHNIGDWLALEVSNDFVSLSVVPEIGGRVVDLSLCRTPVFYANPRLRGKSISAADPSLGKNFGGSKVWPAPQGWNSEAEWPGPPDAVFDCGAYDWRSELSSEAASICLTSSHDEYTGTTLRREIKMIAESSSVEVLHSMQNTSRRPVRWSIWQVSQVDAAQGLEIFVPATGFHQTFGDKPYPAIFFDSDENRVRVRYADQVAKFAVKATQGWFTSLDRAQGFVLAETFPVMPAANYPDGAPVAFWISGHGTFKLHEDQVDIGAAPGGCDPHVETEIMGPLTDLAPGESASLRTAWHLATIEAQEIVSVNHCGAVGARLSFEPGSPPRFTGSFGVFWKSTLELIAYDRASQIVGTADFGEVSPSHPVLLEKKVPLPRGTVRCCLVLFDSDHKNLGVLDRVSLY